MEYIALTLYLLGCFQGYHLSNNVIAERGKPVKKMYRIISAIIWPLLSFGFLVAKTLNY